MKITTKSCEDAIQILNAEGSRHKNGWLGVLCDITNESSHQESVAALSSLISAQTPIFIRATMTMLPKYMEDHPEMSQDLAINALFNQLCTRLIVYIYKHTMEVEELGSMFDFEKEGKGKD